MRRKIVIPAILLIVVLAGAGVFASIEGSASKNSAAVPVSPPVPIVAGTVAQHDVPIYLTGVGTVIAYNTDIIRAQIQGQIVSINFTEGQVVHAGDLLAQIDPRPYQAQLDQEEATLDHDKAHLHNGQINLQRYSKLMEQNSIAREQVENQQAAVEEQNAQIKIDQALIEAAKVQLSYTRLTSPIDGMVGIRQIDVGNIISPSNTNGLVVVTQLDPISLIFTLPETDLSKIQQQQQKTNAPLTVLAYSQDNTIKLDQGTLGLVNNEIVQTTGSIQLKANFPNKSNRLWPGSSSTCGCSLIHGMTA